MLTLKEVQKTSVSFVIKNDVELLDLVCSRYPGRRPSDLMGMDDEYEALKFDIGVAHKSVLLEREKENELLHTLLIGMRNIVISNGAEMPNIKPPKPLFKRKNYDETPRLADVLRAVGHNSVMK